MPPLKQNFPGPQNKISHTTGVAVFVGLLIFRIVNSYYVQTFFQPDEYFQALEPAWQIAFGPQSGAWITWEWREQLRTSAHPYLFAGAYKAMDQVCSLLGLDRSDRATALIWAPKLLQAVSAAIMDLATWQTAVQVYGNGRSTSWAALALTVLSPWQWFCSVRTFSNSLEATLTAISLSWFPWRWYLQSNEENKRSLTPAYGMYPALTAAATAFYLRPTNVIVWMGISVGLVLCNHSTSRALTLIQSAAVVGTAVLVAIAGIDWTFYGEWAFPPLRFLYLNLVQDLATFYGRNRHDYYFTEGLPLLLTTAVPFAATGVWQSLRKVNRVNRQGHIEKQTRFVFAFASAGMVVVLSVIAHKEMRFIYPLLPMLHILAAEPFVRFLGSFPIPRLKLRQVVLAGVVAANIFIASYVSMTHQRGVVDVMHYLRHRQEAWVDVAKYDTIEAVGRSNITVGFLMPCHSTPWRSHLVYPEVLAWALTCEPPVNMSPEDRAIYLDEADQFYADPTTWLEQNMMESTAGSASDSLDKRVWPDYLVFFEHLEATMRALPQRYNYKECRRFINTHWIDDARRQGDVIVWCRRAE